MSVQIAAEFSSSVLYLFFGSVGFCVLCVISMVAERRRR